MIHYTLRRLPIGVMSTTGMVGLAWALTTRLDTTAERTMLAVVSTVGLCLACGDAAHAVTGSSPVPLWRRRAVAVLVATGVTFGCWVTAWTLFATFRPGPVTVRGWEVAQWAVVAVSQIAAGALAASNRPDDPPLAAGLFVALVWSAATAGPLHERLFEITDHAITWLALSVVFAAIAAVSSLDPARRLRSRP